MKSKGRFLLALLALLASLTSVGAAADATAAEVAAASAEMPPVRKPNIVLILADDLGFSDLASYGSEVSTPNLDALARSGVRFSNYHTGANCAPTRAMLMSGVDSHLAGVANIPEAMPPELAHLPAYQGVLAEDIVTIAEVLGDAGYHTYMAGKWHLGMTPTLLPSNRGFDQTVALADSGADNWEQKPYLVMYDDANWFENGERLTLPDDFYSSKYLVDKAIEQIDSNLADGQPFFSYIPLQAVHIPVQAPRAFTEKYLDAYHAGWSALRKQRYKGAIDAGVMPAGISMAEMDASVDWDSLTDEQRRYEAKSMAVYAGMIEAMDHHLGRLITYLKARGEYDNTVFVFTSDNGAEPSDIYESISSPLMTWVLRRWMDDIGYHDDYERLGEKGSYQMIGPSFASAAAAPLSFYKFYAGEGGMRVPMIISGLPTPLAGQVSDAFTYVTDLFPTLMAVAGTGLPEQIDGRTVQSLEGRSLLSVIQGEADQVHDEAHITGFDLSGNSALFQGDYKLIRNQPPLGDGVWRLFNIVSDPGETEDLAAVAPERFAAMLQAYEDYADTKGIADMPEGYTYGRQVLANTIEKKYGDFMRTGGVMLVVILTVVLVAWLRRRRTGPRPLKP